MHSTNEMLSKVYDILTAVEPILFDVKEGALQRVRETKFDKNKSLQGQTLDSKSMTSFGRINHAINNSSTSMNMFAPPSTVSPCSMHQTPILPQQNDNSNNMSALGSSSRREIIVAPDSSDISQSLSQISAEKAELTKAKETAPEDLLNVNRSHPRN